ncbi:MAG TPA: transposase [Chloroflexi bacterium]|jgi:REP element-mobilizing transposase RayT|nr:transposase [Chloroflexota bacterium]HBY45952.1 transposase [Chloroflexota bacterium]
MTGHTRRSSPRLPGYDYRQQNYYFVTICTKNHVCRFGAIRNDIICLSDAGAIVTEIWSSLPSVEPDLHLDVWIVMPNHVHGIIVLHDTDEPRAHDLSTIVGRFKATSARAINHRLGREGETVWHRSFYDHIIRNDADLSRIREYVANNPARWETDQFYQ